MENHPVHYEERDDFARNIYQEHHEALLFYAIGLCRRFRMDISLADDLLQEFYFKLLQHSQRVSVGIAEKGIGYLYTMLRYQLVEVYRKGKSLQRLNEFADGNPLNISGTCIYYFCMEMHTEEFLLEIERLLPDDQFSAINLYVKGFIYREIAAEMSISTTKVCHLVNKAKEILFDHFYCKH